MKDRAGEVWQRSPGELFVVVRSRRLSHCAWHEIVWLESGKRSRMEERTPWEIRMERFA